jgi:hypothetical protein
LGRLEEESAFGLRPRGMVLGVVMVSVLLDEFIAQVMK